MERFESPIPVVNCAVLRARRILLLLRADPPRQGRWAFPAGYAEPGESAEQAMLRELIEETGLETPVRYLCSFGRHGHDGRSYLSLCFTAEADQEEIVTNEESLDWRWVPLRRDVLERIDWAFESHRVVALELAEGR